MFSEKQKETIRKVTKFGKKNKQKAYVKLLKDNLYTLGFEKEVLQELSHTFETTNDNYLRRLVAWELALWHANHYTKEDAKKALPYLDAATTDEKDTQQLQRIAIVKAESLQHLNRVTEAKEVLHERLQVLEHPDLYLGLANLEDDVRKRFKMMNKAFQMYDLEEIKLSNEDIVDYDLLDMTTYPDKIKAEEKVSVILPAYNAETGLHVAIESILNQTWENLELIIVDDCSPDGTYDVAKRYEALDERVKVLQTPVNSGPYIARNIGLKAATGAFVTINDADDWSHVRKLEKQVKHLINNPSVIANTSEHARLTEELTLYRRGTPGRYIFPNMSSIMFRREEVLEKIGYWDEVRFAADGEFKRRLVRTFGVRSYVDLTTGPLSLPRQSVSSLTSSSAFGYNGFFMGVRKEYVESIDYAHAMAEHLKYHHPQERRPFPVPEPMWPQREEKIEQFRSFDIVIAADFRCIGDDTAPVDTIKKIAAENEDARIGLVQMYIYDLSAPLTVHEKVRELIDGRHIQMLVYGEKIATKELIYQNANLLQFNQKYIPEINAEQIKVIIHEKTARLQDDIVGLNKKHDKVTQLIPFNDQVRAQVKDTEMMISNENWV